ncbi:RlmE family RNA methyltransferase [Hyphomonas johnsonii]|uniref:Ribosomal RNA large subunit methyltransferase E n=1 Tax=Hyphomonas johnsonii MHS-2 TaxID=1280950 RepID=A0A059FUR1_9PROT|nr:RlmE family RNA methyltransferase [Hyphomonas johnsonii]KCZ94404.1 23S rRNA methyltransferase J [Hyphomonas johnsonii MHS-2]
MTDEEKRRWKGPTGKEGSSGRQTGERKIHAHRAKSDSSKKWLERQLADPYVRKAKDAGFRARAAYKLLEIDTKLGLLKQGQRIVDLGCAPGGWLQVAVAKGAREVVGIDLLPVDPVEGAHIVQGDVNEPADVARMMAGLTAKPDLVLSDMAANTTGHRQTDHLRTVALVELAVGFAIEHLSPGGAFCSKVFQGGATKDVLESLKAHFTTVKHIKPPASRAGSPEIFVVAKGFKG